MAKTWLTLQPQHRRGHNFNFTTCFIQLRNPPRPSQIHIELAHRCYRRSLQLTRDTIPYAPTLPLVGTPRGRDKVTETALTIWHEAGIETLGDLYLEGTLLTFETLAADSGIPVGQFLLHTAITRTLTLAWGDVTTEPPTHLLIQY